MILAARQLTKRFPGVIALKDVSFDLRAGEINALCGENGAGKSTLLKMVAGMVVPDTGEVRVAGSRLAPHTPREAIARGVAMVMQHFALVPVFTVLENVVLGAEPKTAFGGVDWATARARLAKVAAQLGAQLPPDARAADLGVGDFGAMVRLTDPLAQLVPPDLPMRRYAHRTAWLDKLSHRFLVPIQRRSLEKFPSLVELLILLAKPVRPIATIQKDKIFTDHSSQFWWFNGYADNCIQVRHLVLGHSARNAQYLLPLRTKFRFVPTLLRRNPEL
jgi:ABC-type sugar transport system ATPase subunit